MTLKKTFTSLLIAGTFILLAGVFVPQDAQAQGADNSSPPEAPAKLIFIHHSVGENWLADGYGNLGVTLEDNNYFVSDTNYGWGPDSIGDATDTINWPDWFLGSESDRYLDALYNESDANAGGWTYYTRRMTDPGGENTIIMFKSCFPNSDFGGSPGDPPTPGYDLTVGTAKYIYNQLLTYFATRPDKLFIVVTSPPMQYIENPENAQAFNAWLVNDWLEENDYTLNNVAVFDLYTVLTHPDNHHRFVDGEVQYITSHGDGTLYYDSAGDDHPSAAGSQKATDEFVPLLNVFYNRWQAGGPPSSPPDTGESPDSGTSPEGPSGAALPGGMIDDFESGPLPGTDGWAFYWDEGTETTISCATTGDMAYGGSNSLEIEFSVLPGSWASCELLFYDPQDWSTGEGLSFYVHASEPGLRVGVMVYYQEADEKIGHHTSFVTSETSADGWDLVTIPWADLDMAINPSMALGVAFLFDNEDMENIGTVWLDDLGLAGTPEEAPAPPPADTGDNEEAEVEEETEPEEDDDGGGFSLPCGSSALLILFAFAGVTWIRRRYDLK